MLYSNFLIYILVGSFSLIVNFILVGKMRKKLKPVVVMALLTLYLGGCTIFATPICFITNPQDKSSRNECNRCLADFDC